MARHKEVAMTIRAVVFDVGGVLEHRIDTNLDGEVPWV
jgi:hypothetical protein